MFNVDNAKEMETPIHPTRYLGLDEESKKVGQNPINSNDWIIVIPYSV